MIDMIQPPLVKSLVELAKGMKEAGVREFSGFGVQLKFERNLSVGIESPERVAEETAQIEADVKQEQLDNLRLTDPVAYEELVATDVEHNEGD